MPRKKTVEETVETLTTVNEASKPVTTIPSENTEIEAAEDIADVIEKTSVKQSFDEYEEEEESSEEENENSKDDLIKKNTSRYNARVETMSKQKKKEIYASEHVITDYGVTDLETESTQKKTEYTELVASQKSHKILHGKMIGYHFANEDDPTSTILAEISYGKGYFNIVIPSYLLFDYELNEKYTSKEENEIIERLMTKRINSPIDFMVHTIDKNGMVFADRLAALSMKGVNNYVSKNRKAPRIQEGLLVESTVCMVSRTFVIVEALGAEIRINQPELSWFHIGDAREEFSVGQKVIVRILSAKEYKTSKYTNSYTLIDATASIKAAQKDRRKEYYDSFRIGGRYAATVTYVEKDVFVNLAGKMDALIALPTFGKIPVRGDERIVEITGKDESKLFIYGIFVNN